MIRANELKEKITNNGYSVPAFSKLLGIDTSTFYRKIKAGGETFSIGETKKMANLLNLSYQEINTIFFGL